MWPNLLRCLRIKFKCLRIGGIHEEQMSYKFQTILTKHGNLNVQYFARVLFNKTIVFIFKSQNLNLSFTTYFCI